MSTHRRECGSQPPLTEPKGRQWECNRRSRGGVGRGGRLGSPAPCRPALACVLWINKQWWLCSWIKTSWFAVRCSEDQLLNCWSDGNLWGAFCQFQAKITGHVLSFPMNFSLHFPNNLAAPVFRSWVLGFQSFEFLTCKNFSVLAKGKQPLLKL